MINKRHYLSKALKQVAAIRRDAHSEASQIWKSEQEREQLNEQVKDLKKIEKRLSDMIASNSNEILNRIPNFNL